ncbi:MAG: DUF1329 domain-containing protein, partial [Limnobacter sp.]|nr:DUF1329 domain-containing protein [Limnobacter sp.]
MLRISLGQTVLKTIGLGATLCIGLSLMATTHAFAQELTPIGAEKAGNADGSIPPWTGGLTTPPDGFDPEKGFKDPFPDDKPLYVIDQSNVEQYQSLLTPGQQALVKRYANYKIPVYPT